MSIDCEIWMRGGVAGINARFSVLPRAGELIQVPGHGEHPRRFVVSEVVHIDLDMHGDEARPSIQLWVKDAESDR